MARTRPSKGFLERDKHRHALTLHFAAMVMAIGLCAVLNRALTPDRFWVHWAALAFGALFLVHLAHFSKGTLATMSGRERASEDAEG